MKIDKVLETIERDFKGKATDGTGGCVYLATDNKKCYVGLFIPNGHEACNFEGTVSFLLEEYPDLINKMPTKIINKLANLQNAHDTYGINNINELTLDEQKMYLQLESMRVLT